MELASFTAGDAIPLSIQIKGASLVIRASLSRFEIRAHVLVPVHALDPIGVQKSDTTSINKSEKNAPLRMISQLCSLLVSRKICSFNLTIL